MLNQTFEAQAFHPDFGNEVLNGKLSFAGWTLHFHSGDTALEIPFDRLETEAALDDDRLFFTDREQPGLKIITDDPAFWNCHTLPQVQRIRENLTAKLSRRELSRRLKIVGYFFAACILITLVCTVALSLMVRIIVTRIPQEREAQWGADVLAELKKDMKFVDDTNYVSALEELAEPLMRAIPATTNFTFYVVDNKEPNAFALPGGHIVVFTGLMDITDQPEELLAVIAHEVAHVTCKHHLRHEIAAGGPLLIFRTFMRGRAGAGGMLTGMSALMVTQGFSRAYEKEADDVGWDYLVEANIDPRGMANIFRKFRTYIAGHGGLELPQAFADHPLLEKRIKHLEARWEKLQHKSGFIDFKQNAAPQP